MDELCLEDGGKRIRLAYEDIDDDIGTYSYTATNRTTTIDRLQRSASLGATDGQHDSGSDCVAMESPIGDDDEPYIDVVSEDSAIQEEEPIDDFTAEETSYSQLSPMDNLMSSHDDSAIIKSEIFDPAIDELHEMLASTVGDYEHAFLCNMDTTSNLLTQAHRSFSDSALNQSLTEKLPESMATNLLNDVVGSSKSETDVQFVNSSELTSNGISSTSDSVGNNNNSASNSSNDVNSPVLTTPVFIAQGAPGPAGQTNSIITTHMARLVPSPDGKGYILHLGLNPAANMVNGANNGGVGGAQLQTNSNTSSALTPSITGTLSVNSVNSPANLNITITPAATQALASGDVATPVSADLNASSSSPLGGTTLETDQEGNIFLKHNANVSAGGAQSNHIGEFINVNDPIGTKVDVSQIAHVSKSLMNSVPDSLLAGPTLIGNTDIQLSDSCREHQQLLKQMQLLQQQQQLSGQSQHKSKSSKRRNSRELRELVELEKISSSKSGGELDRFVICSDGPMNCALCGYNTGSYSSFKSHIICSHPCWRITKKLSRNRLLVEKSVKVSIPVANFSVPNPVPAVPIQQRVQSKKNKKESNSGNSRHEKSSKNSKNKQSSKTTSAIELDDFDSDFIELQNDMADESDLFATSSNTSIDKDSLSVRERQLIERNKRLFRCTRCMRLFVFEGSVVSHIMEQHGIKKTYDFVEVSNDYGSTWASLFRCPNGNCCFTTGSARALEQHKADKHPAILKAVHRCQICGYFADSPSAVKDHAARIHPEQDMMYGIAD